MLWGIQDKERAGSVLVDSIVMKWREWRIQVKNGEACVGAGGRAGGDPGKGRAAGDEEKEGRSPTFIHISSEV